jgi:hypothetical protein
MRLWLGASGSEPGRMRWRVRAERPFPADPVDPYRVQGQDTVGTNVQTNEMLEVLMVLSCIPHCFV